MPHQALPSFLTGVAKSPDVKLPTANKTPLRTYSRRSLKRRHTSPPARDLERFIRRTGSLNATARETVEQRNGAKAQQPSQPISSRGRKRLEFLTSAENKTPNDLAWEALASSAPASTRQDDATPDEGPPEAHIVNCSPGHEVSVHQQPAVSDALGGPTKCGEGRSRRNAASEAEFPENVSLEESDIEEESSEPGQDNDADTTALTSSSEGDDISISRTSGSQKPKIRGRFLIFDRSPPKGYKVLHKSKTNPETKAPVLKKRQELTDGFTEVEARPIFLGKRRRLQYLDINVGSLDLTQTGSASQQRQKEISTEAEKRPQDRTTAGLWRGRQYFSASQFEIESQDPAESSDAKELPVKRYKTGLDKHGRRIPLLDNFGPIVIPRTDSPQPEKTCKQDSSRGSPIELVRDSSPSTYLLRKRNMNSETGEGDSLTLRPGPPSWPRSDFVITDTPLLGGDTSP